jgi:hypothetical protein
LRGGDGDDRLYSDNGEADEVRCGPGRDRAVVDSEDAVSGCERIRRS